MRDLKHAVMGERSMCGPAAIFEKFQGVVDSSCMEPSAASQALCWNNDSGYTAAVPECAQAPWRHSSCVRRQLIA